MTMTKNKKNKNKSTTALAFAEKRRKDQLVDESILLFPIKSGYFEIGSRLRQANPTSRRHQSLALDAFLRGSKTDGCIRCMIRYYQLHETIHGVNMILPLRLPWVLEATIRGSYHALTHTLSGLYFGSSQQQATSALNYYWMKRVRVLHPQLPTNAREVLKGIKEHDGDICAVCEIACCDDPNKLVVQCSGCRYYSYCSKEHQIEHWNTWNHRGECKQLQILNTYHKPYAKRIHQAILRGVDPTRIREFQTLRTKLGLNRPTADYEEDAVASFLQDDDEDNDDKDEDENDEDEDDNGDGDDGNDNDNANNNTNNNNKMKYFVARSDGTVHIGSTPELI